MKLLPAILISGSLVAGAYAGSAFVRTAPFSIAPLPGAEDVSGEISAVDLEANTFTLWVEGDASNIQISVTDETVYMLNGEASTKEDALKVGHLANVAHEELVASSVSASTPE